MRSSSHTVWIRPPSCFSVPSVRREAGGEQQTLPVAGLHRDRVHGKGGARVTRNAGGEDLENGPKPREAQQLRVAPGQNPATRVISATKTTLWGFSKRKLRVPMGGEGWMTDQQK